MTNVSSFDDLSLASDVFPGGTLLSAIFDRDLMRLSDRGGASGIIGDRWAEMCAIAIDGRTFSDPDSLAPGTDSVSRVVRLDDIPAIAAAASRQKLQNPDFVLIGDTNGQQFAQAVDAKFSAETARSRQVSADVLAELLAIGPIVSDHIGEIAPGTELRDGWFLCPDYSLTHYMIAQRRGTHRIAVRREELVLVPVTAESFLSGVEGRSLLDLFSRLDAMQERATDSLLVSLYELRIARAAVACWLDQSRPLLGPKDMLELDLDAVEAAARDRVRGQRSSWEVIARWDDDAEETRRQRIAIDHVASVPISGAELRKEIEEAASAVGVEAPSANRVRRRIGAWYRKQLLDAVGPLLPPVADFGSVLDRLGHEARQLRTQVATETTDIILEMVTDLAIAADATPTGSGSRT
ncbi:MAG: hypothetical protein WBA46_03375 [Thermomicrobiales bacterium]